MESRSESGPLIRPGALSLVALRMSPETAPYGWALFPGRHLHFLSTRSVEPTETGLLTEAQAHWQAYARWVGSAISLGLSLTGSVHPFRKKR